MIRRAAYVRAQIRLEYQFHVRIRHHAMVGAVIPLVSQRCRPIAIYGEYGRGGDEVGAVELQLIYVWRRPSAIYGDCGHGS